MRSTCAACRCLTGSACLPSRTWSSINRAWTAWQAIAWDGLALTLEGLQERDRLVLQASRTIPLVITLGGGYAEPIERTARGPRQYVSHGDKRNTPLRNLSTTCRVSRVVGSYELVRRRDVFFLGPDRRALSSERPLFFSLIEFGPKVRN